jgi:hypothetical protein
MRISFSSTRRKGDPKDQYESAKAWRQHWTCDNTGRSLEYRWRKVEVCISSVSRKVSVDLMRYKLHVSTVVVLAIVLTPGQNPKKAA